MGATITSLGRASIAPLTKFRVPRERGDTVERGRVLASLQASVANNPLTLVVAPGGSGKTTALVQLAAALRGSHAVVWVSVDREDDDPNRFFAALVDAFGPLQLAWEVDPRSLLAGVDEDGSRRRAAVAALVNALCTASNTRIALVVDDLHRLETPGVAQLLEALLERLPEHVAVVIGSRTLPALPLERWRAHGELGEVALDALRFDEPEAVAMARAKHPSEATMPDVATIRSAVARTRGWAVGLSMLLQSAGPRSGTAGASPDARADASADGLPAWQQARGSGANPRLFGYLASEILAKLPPAMQRFVTRCAILDELEPGTCEAVSGDADAGAKLGALLRSNLFVTTVDEFVPILRFHDLFRDFLLAELERREAASIPALHDAAARAERSQARAIQHFLRAGAWDEAIARIARCGDELLRQGAIATLERWLEQIPSAVLADDAEVAYFQGCCGWLRWDWDRARRGLRAAVRGMDKSEQLARRIGATFQLVDALASSGERDEARALLDEFARLPLDARGRYLVKITGCNDCHTAGYTERGGEVAEADWLTGVPVGFRGPWGVSYPANLRRSVEGLTEAQWMQFARAPRLPPMPWFALRDMSDADLRDLYRFMRSLGPKGERVPATVAPGAPVATPVIDFVPQMPAKSRATAAR